MIIWGSGGGGGGASQGVQVAGVGGEGGCKWYGNSKYLILSILDLHIVTSCTQ